MVVAVCTDAALAHYNFGQNHPFGPARFDAFYTALEQQGLIEQVLAFDAVEAGQPTLELFHTHRYVEKVKRASLTGSGYLDRGDTPAFAGVYQAAARVVGTSVAAAGMIMRGECRRAFTPIAGLHHARRNSAAGFCVFNDCGVVIEWLKQQGLQRIAYVDIDAHHGDGVFYGFESDPQVAFVDLHEDGRYLYPGTGAASETGSGDAKGCKLNLPLPMGADDGVFEQLWPQVENFIERFAPQFILLQCGADSIQGDPITHMAFSPAVHAKVTAQLCKLADRHSEGRLLAMGGGGYRSENIAAAWSAVVQALLANTGAD